jgi:hypothetical protein
VAHAHTSRPRRWPLASRPAPVLVHHRDPGKPVLGHTLPNGVGPARDRRQHESHGQLLRQQRASGTLLQFAEERTRAASAVSESGRGPAGDRGVYRGVLYPPALASGAGLSEPRGGRADGRMSLHPGVRYFRATSGLAITQLPFDTSFVPRLSASDAAHRVGRPIILLSGAGIRFYRGAQQHDPVSSTTCLWPAR